MQDFEKVYIVLHVDDDGDTSFDEVFSEHKQAVRYMDSVGHEKCELVEGIASWFV